MPSYQFKIQLQNISKPPVWRRLVVPEHFTFYQFHQVIQEAFGWQDYHLFQFSPGSFGTNPVIADPELLEDEDEIVDCYQIKIPDIFKSEGQTFSYIYDFGDDWHHQITLEKIIDGSLLHADCRAGKGACPPEDCGGSWGYESLKEAMANPKHPEHKELKNWLGLKKDETWDPTFFDLQGIQEALRQL